MKYDPMYDTEILADHMGFILLIISSHCLKSNLTLVPHICVNELDQH